MIRINLDIDGNYFYRVEIFVYYKSVVLSSFQIESSQSNTFTHGNNYLSRFSCDLYTFLNIGKQTVNIYRWIGLFY